MGPHRVSPGNLSVSRTVGDAIAKLEILGGNKKVVISEPDIYVFDLSKDDVDYIFLACDGVYDQLTSRDIFNCAWLVLNYNIDLFKNNNKGNVKKNISEFKGNYGPKINMNTTSGNIVDFILKASMLRKSFDNVTCLFIAFKNFFETDDDNNKKEETNIKNDENTQKESVKELVSRNNKKNKVGEFLEIEEKRKYSFNQNLNKEHNETQKKSIKNNSSDQTSNKEILSMNKKIEKKPKIEISPVSKIRINSVPGFHYDRNHYTTCR